MKKRKQAGPESGEGPSRRDAAADVNLLRWGERKASRSSATGPPRLAPEAKEPEVMGPCEAKRQEVVGQAMRAPQAMGPAAVTPGAHDHKSNHKVKRRGRLDRAVLAMLGKGLEDCFDEVRKQEVPERFKLLLRQF